jgi:hypothetical protein
VLSALQGIYRIEAKEARILTCFRVLCLVCGWIGHKYPIMGEERAAAACEHVREERVQERAQERVQERARHT